MAIIEIKSLNEPGIEVFSTLTEAQLRMELEPEKGLFIAESPKVIRVALDAGWEPTALLCERKHIEGDARDIIARAGDIPIYTGTRELLAQLTGYTLTRGVLCAMRRRKMPAVAEVVKDARRIVVIEAVTDTTNIGAIFRSAAALGMDGALLTSDCCDPLIRRALRVSMGTVLQMPWTYLPDDWLPLLHDMGFTTAAMALTDRSVAMVPHVFDGIDKLAIVLGTEGEGLADKTIADCDYTVKIPMTHGVDSLNVAAASAVAFWQLGRQ
jgi:tRNA G18 (ribose-2'-O)-methylase SpoU